MDTILNNAKAFVNNEIVDCSLAIDDGKILKIDKEARMPPAEAKIDLKGLLVLPGLIDAHVHLRDEGKAYKEDFYSGTAAAAAGGVTTVLDMPNNDPVTMSAQTLRNRMAIAERGILVNVGFLSEFPRKAGEIEHIVDEGAVAFKLFMAEQVGGLDIGDDDSLTKAFGIVAGRHSTVAVHAEDKAMIKHAEDEFKRANRNDIEAFLEAHSESVEIKAVDRVLKLVDQTMSRVHVCHVSTEEVLGEITRQKKRGLSVTCEATPHHMFLSAGDFGRVGTLALTMPPVRQARHSAALLAGIKSGWVDVIASDHAPHKLEEKEAKSVWDVKVGVPGLETTVPLLLTHVNNGVLSLADLVKLMSEGPARVFGLKGRGTLTEGNAADLTIVDMKAKYRIDSARFHSKAKHSPFQGWLVQGQPVKTFVNGHLVMDRGEIVAEAGTGEIVRRALR